MNYAELTATINDELEYTFTADQIKTFVQQAEKLIYNVIQFPALRKTTTVTFTADQTTLTLPADFVWLRGLSVIDSNGAYSYLLFKDPSFMREAYPDVTATGLPKFYAMDNEDTLLVAPTPDQAYNAQLEYGYYPESIVTAGNTWLGDEFDNALLNAALLEAARFNKLEPDVIQNYMTLYQSAMTALDKLASERLNSDKYR